MCMHVCDCIFVQEIHFYWTPWGDSERWQSQPLSCSPARSPRLSGANPHPPLLLSQPLGHTVQRPLRTIRYRGDLYYFVALSAD